MLDQINEAIEAYHQKWHTLVGERQNKQFFQRLRPTAVGWKAEDKADFDTKLTSLQGHCDQIHLGWINERWLATLHLKDEPLNCGITIIKLMQRRPGSTDTVGLDHLDFFASNIDKLMLDSEPELKWTEEMNGDHCRWISVWFEGTEAKLRSDTVLQACADELSETQETILTDL